MGLRCIGAEVVIEVTASYEWPAWLMPQPPWQAPDAPVEPAAEGVTA